MSDEYQRIIYPERAEYLLDEGAFRGYKISLDHWNDITIYLQEAFEVLRTRRFSKALIIHGNQGCGKSVLANKIYGDFTVSRAMDRANPQYDSANIWHRITAGPSTSAASVMLATANAVVLQAENRKTWVDEAIKSVSGNKDRSCLVIADNCERDYFLQGLLGISDEAYLAVGRTEATLKAAANRFVELCRTSMRGCFFVFFTNDQDFALAFDKHVNDQHKGLVDIRDLPMPADLQKEAIVRINVNRLNPFSYWFCLDRAGPTEKKSVWGTLKGADTFPASFAAVDTAIRSSTRVREGKPGRKCVLNAFVLCNALDAAALLPATPTDVNVENLYSGACFAIRMYRSGWNLLFGGSREYKMLESEWNLKLILANDMAVSALLAADPRAKRAIELSTVYHSPGTHTSTRQSYSQELLALEADLQSAFPTPANAAFWAKGSLRNHEYESRLKTLFPTYNTKRGGFLTARPDLVLSDYVPCSILASPDDGQASLSVATRRDASVIEFTAIKDFSLDKLIAYLRDQKLHNYVAAVQEQ